MAAKDETATEPGPELAQEPAQAETASLVGAAYPTTRVKANVSLRGILAGAEGDVPDDDETAALLSSGLFERA